MRKAEVSRVLIGFVVLVDWRKHGTAVLRCLPEPLETSREKESFRWFLKGCSAILSVLKSQVQPQELYVENFLLHIRGLPDLDRVRLREETEWLHGFLLQIDGRLAVPISERRQATLEARRRFSRIILMLFPDP